MKLREMYETAVRLGIQADPRGKQGVDRFLERTRERHEKLPDYLKEVFDKEELTNPFADTRIYVGDPEAEIITILGGIDMNVGEVLLADRLREKGTQIDAIYTHHPEGWGLSKLDLVMSVQADIWAGVGVPIQAGERLIDERRKDVRHRLMPINHTQAIDAARLLGVPFWSAHTPTDNLVFDYLTTYFAGREPQTLEDVRKMLFDLPEYRIATRRGAGPSLVDGSGESRAGKVLVDMTGGTEGPVKAIAQLADKGIGTIVCMHMSEDLRKASDEHNIHVVIAGHMASDSLGINLLMDELERGGVTLVPTSGLIRVRRNQKREVVEEVPVALPL
jgi:hypothetical protein